MPHFFFQILFNHSTSTHIPALIIGLCRIADRDAPVARSVDEFECVVCVDLGHDADMTDAFAARTSVKEYQVTGFEFVTVNARTVVDLPVSGAVKFYTEVLEYITCKTRAVKTTG